MVSLKILLVEDSESDIDTCKNSIKVFERQNGSKVELTVSKSLTEANDLLDNSFDGAIVDLKLGNALSEENYDGNEVIKQIYENFRIPVAILTGTPEQVEESQFRNLGVFKKGEISYNDLITRFNSIYKTGLTHILGGRGRIEQAMNKVFWNNLIPNINSWEAQVTRGEATEDALLRFTLNHLFEFIDHDTEKCLPEEMYVSPPISGHLRTGSIVKAKESDEYYMVLTPACDLVLRAGVCKAEKYLFCHIDSFIPVRDKVLSNYTLKTTEQKRDALKNLISNNYSLFYHWLPSTTFFGGGFINFRKTSALFPKDYERDFDKPLVQVSNHFIKDIVARFSTYYARQGQPDFDFKNLSKRLFKEFEAKP